MVNCNGTFQVLHKKLLFLARSQSTRTKIDLFDAKNGYDMTSFSKKGTCTLDYEVTSSKWEIKVGENLTFITCRNEFLKRINNIASVFVHPSNIHAYLSYTVSNINLKVNRNLKRQRKKTTKLDLHISRQLAFKLIIMSTDFSSSLFPLSSHPLHFRLI